MELLETKARAGLTACGSFAAALMSLALACSTIGEDDEGGKVPESTEEADVVLDVAKLSDPERVVVADILRSAIREHTTEFSLVIRASGVTVTIRDKDAEDEVRAAVLPFFAQRDQVAIRVGPPMAMKLIPLHVASQFISVQGVDMRAIGEALEEAFPAACESNVKTRSNGDTRSFAGDARIWPSEGFRGRVVKQRYVVTLEPVNDKSVRLDVRSDVWWRRASSNDWRQIQALSDQPPESIDLLGVCRERLEAKVQS